jgi:hypothetical protein
MQERQISLIDSMNLRNYATMCECATEVATFGILSDFVKKGVADFYSYKSKGEELAADEMKVLTDKFQEMQKFFEKLKVATE